MPECRRTRQKGVVDIMFLICQAPIMSTIIVGAWLVQTHVDNFFAVHNVMCVMEKNANASDGSNNTGLLGVQPQYILCGEVQQE